MKVRFLSPAQVHLGAETHMQYVIGNWKMHTTVGEAVALAGRIEDGIEDLNKEHPIPTVVICTARDIVEQDMVDEAVVEHASAKDLIAQIEAMQPDEELYDAKVTVLGEYKTWSSRARCSWAPKTSIGPITAPTPVRFPRPSLPDW